MKHSAQTPMVRRPLPALLLVLAAAAAHAGPRTSTNYSILTDTADAGGQRTTSAAYTNDGSTGAVAGVSTVASPAEFVKGGYVGQLYDVTGLAVNPAAPSVNETATLQLAAWQVLDDTSYLAVPATSVAWSVLSGPVIGISSAGEATAGVVSQSTSATVQGSFGGYVATASFTVTVTLLTPANWRQYWYGPGTTNSGAAADTAAPYGNGLTNFETFALIGPSQNPATAQNSQLPRLQMAGGNLTYSFVQPAGVSGVVYGAQYTTSVSPANWQPVADTGSGAVHTFTVPISGATQLFLRLLMTEQ